MYTDLLRIWTWVAGSTPYADNHYAMNTFLHDQ